jgi:abortive infection bacteriophage resistance protein
MPYTKPWISFSDQLQQLKYRGMLVEDDSAAENYLDRIGYYRLSGYWYPFRRIDPTNPKKRLDQFEGGTHFTDALDLYVFDKKLRLLALDALERIEVAIRVDIAHLLGERDPFAYKDQSFLDGKFTKPKKRKTTSDYDQWLSKHTHLIQRSRESFIKKFKAKYGLPLPFWIAIEVWDFGTMSLFYAGMKGNDRDFIAQKYKVQKVTLFRAGYVHSII